MYIKHKNIITLKCTLTLTQFLKCVKILLTNSLHKYNQKLEKWVRASPKLQLLWGVPRVQWSLSIKVVQRRNSGDLPQHTFRGSSGVHASVGQGCFASRKGTDTTLAR